MKSFTSFTGAGDQGYDYMVPVWKLAKRNNEKPKVVVERKSKPDAKHMVYWG